MGAGGTRVRKGRIGRTLKLVLSIGLFAFSVDAYYQVKGATEDWHDLLADWRVLLVPCLTLLVSVSGLAALWLGPLRRPKPLPDGSLVFARSGWGRTWSALSGVVITGIFTATIVRGDADESSNWIMLAIFGFVFLGSAYQLLRPNGPVTLSPQGIAGADRRHPSIAWSDIETLTFRASDHGGTIEIKLVPPPAPVTTVVRAAKRRKAARVMIMPSTLGADGDVMMNALEEFRERYGNERL
jgi:hypothetical protein